jgi:hypothetical protein
MLLSPAFARSLSLAALLLGSCQSVYYSTMSRFGVDKRDILVDRTEMAGESMSELQARIVEMARAYRDTLEIESGELRELHEQFSDSYDRAEDAAEDFHERIDDIQSVAETLFEEWKDENELIMDVELRKESNANYETAQTSYAKLVRTLRNVQTALDPLLTRYHDHVVFMKLNMNRTALAPLVKNQEALFAETSGLGKLLGSAIVETRNFAERIDY